MSHKQSKESIALSVYKCYYKNSRIKNPANEIFQGQNTQQTNKNSRVKHPALKCYKKTYLHNSEKIKYLKRLIII